MEIGLDKIVVIVLSVAALALIIYLNHKGKSRKGPQ